jgi:hypothetical protein
MKSKKDTMLTTEYLYGIRPNILIDLPYKQALELKLESARNLLKTVIKETDNAFKNGKEHTELQQMHYRQKAIVDAIDFTEKLLEELEG